MVVGSGYSRLMRLSCFLSFAILAACAPKEAKDTGGEGTDDRTVGGPGDTDDTDSDTDTDTDTDTWSTTFDCSVLPEPPFQTNTHPIRTQEDFDFAEGGYLVYQSGIAVVGTKKNGVTDVLSPGAAGDPRGVHGLSDGRIVIMSPWDGSIKIADPATGALDVLAGSLNTPNGVEVDGNDRIYFTTYGEVGWTDPDGSNKQVIHSWGGGWSMANGIVLSPDGQQLTVAVPDGNNTDFATIDKLGPDEWGNVQILHSVSGFYSSIDGDVCGNIYTVDYSRGELWRIKPDGSVDNLGTLGGGWGAFSALRFGPGQGGWERDRLYVTNRWNEVYEIEIGVPGRRHPTTPP